MKTIIYDGSLEHFQEIKESLPDLEIILNEDNDIIIYTGEVAEGFNIDNTPSTLRIYSVLQTGWVIRIKDDNTYNIYNN